MKVRIYLKLCVAALCIWSPLGGFSQQKAASQVSSASFKVATWNTEWLSCSRYSPDDDALQVKNVAAVIKALSPDLIAIQEVGTSSSYATVDTLVSLLGSQWAGEILPTSVNANCGQNQGIIYKKATVQLVGSSIVTNGGSYSNWSSGRYPIEYDVNFIVDGTLVPVTLMNIHAKAMSDQASYTRRQGASVGLKALLDGTSYNTKKVIVLGDFNDYLSGTQCSSCSPADSPYKNFVDDATNYKGLTGSLVDPYYNSPVIDNIIISNELFDSYVAGSVKREVTATQAVSSYSSTTSDHYPVSATFTFGTAGTTPSTCSDLHFSQTFLTGLGNFAAYSSLGAQGWSSNATYGATISGYANATNNANEDWLISPSFNLEGLKSATLSFDHALNFVSSATDRVTNHTLWVSSDYSSGAPSTGTWSQLTIPTMASGSSWSFVNSGNIAVPASFLNSNVHFALKYLSTSSVAGTWEVRNLFLDALCSATGIDDVKVGDDASVVAVEKALKVHAAKKADLQVFDVTGRLISRMNNVTDIIVAVPHSGIYLAKLGAQSYKVLVR